MQLNIKKMKTQKQQKMYSNFKWKERENLVQGYSYISIVYMVVLVDPNQNQEIDVYSSFGLLSDDTYLWGDANKNMKVTIKSIPLWALWARWWWWWCCCCWFYPWMLLWKDAGRCKWTINSITYSFWNGFGICCSNLFY